MITDSPSHNNFLADVLKFMPSDRVFTDELRTLAWGTDASFYRLIPKIVLVTADEQEIIRILRTAWLYEVPVTFRAAGTSLSGQSITDSVLVVAARRWEKYWISPDAKTIKVQPGVVAGRLNNILAQYGRIFSPDPASKNAAMVGGIIINNASGMNCGTHANSDRILKSVRIILTDGTILDTGDAASRDEFSRTHTSLIDEIKSIRDTILADEELVRRIKYKYSIKNVVGLNLLPFVTFEDPFDIISHCIVGSEGTLAFLSEATLSTSHLYPCQTSGMIYFKDISEASRCVVALKTGSPVFSCEMLDKKSLEAVNDSHGTGLTALLIDTKADTPQELQANVERIKEVIHRFDTAFPPEFSNDAEQCAEWWSLRSGIFPAVGGTRKPGTSVIIEDVAFHIADLPNATRDLQKLLIECGYEDACIYGHALEGNYHFIISQSFETPEDIARYKHLMEEIEHLVIDRYDGSLKAEHGVGRNVAPFIEKEWGPRAMSYMRRIKDAFDPSNILNRGVIFNEDPDCYIKNFKHLPLANPIVDKCIECGFCEPNCVSAGYTMSARTRIVVYREIVRLRREGTQAALARATRLEKAFKYPGNETCAGDGLCSTSCPMKINTGELIHQIREQNCKPGSFIYKIGENSAHHLSSISSGMRLALGAASVARSVIGNNGVNAVGKSLHALGLPLWTAALPKPYSIQNTAKAVAESDTSSPSPDKVVYFPSCINRTMGVTPEKHKDIAPLVDTMVKLCHKAGFEVIFPKGMDSLCCGMIWESKGMPAIADEMTEKLEKALLKASENGKYPVLCDQSPCLHRMRNHIKSMHLYEPAEFISKFLAPNLEFHPTNEPIAVHVTCSTRQMNLGPVIINLAHRCSNNVTVPPEVGCCGFAGDKGFMYPEINKWALRKLRPCLERAGVKAGYSNSRTCEIGLTTNSGISYKSIVYLVDECTTAKR